MNRSRADLPENEHAPLGLELGAIAVAQHGVTLVFAIDLKSALDRHSDVVDDRGVVVRAHEVNRLNADRYEFTPDVLGPDSGAARDLGRPADDDDRDLAVVPGEVLLISVLGRSSRGFRTEVFIEVADLTDNYGAWGRPNTLFPRKCNS